MMRADKFGFASVVCLALAVLPPYENWKQPLNALLMFVSFALAYAAGRAGRPVWYAMCVFLLLVLGVAMYLAMKAL